MSFNSYSCSCFRTSVAMLVSVVLAQVAIIRGLNHVGPLDISSCSLFFEVCGRASLYITRYWN